MMEDDRRWVGMEDMDIEQQLDEYIQELEQMVPEQEAALVAQPVLGAEEEAKHLRAAEEVERQTSPPPAKKQRTVDPVQDVPVPKLPSLVEQLKELRAKMEKDFDEEIEYDKVDWNIAKDVVWAINKHKEVRPTVLKLLEVKARIEKKHSFAEFDSVSKKDWYDLESVKDLLSSWCDLEKQLDARAEEESDDE